MISKKQDGTMGTRTTAQPATGKPRQATDKPPLPIPSPPAGDYMIPRQEAAYSIGFSAGFEAGMKAARDERDGETREITATVVRETQVTSRPAWWLLDGPRTTEAGDRGLSWVVLTMNALMCVMLAYIVIKLMMRGL